MTAVSCSHSKRSGPGALASTSSWRPWTVSRAVDSAAASPAAPVLNRSQTSSMSSAYQRSITPVPGPTSRADALEAVDGLASVLRVPTLESAGDGSLLAMVTICSRVLALSARNNRRSLPTRYAGERAGVITNHSC